MVVVMVVVVMIVMMVLMATGTKDSKGETDVNYNTNPVCNETANAPVPSEPSGCTSQHALAA
eukprot:7234071-Pyramimonas_sp.AAC.1